LEATMSKHQNRVEEVWTVGQTATAYKVSIRTIYRWWAQDLIPKPIRIGRSIRWRRRDVEKHIEGLSPVATGGTE